MLCQVVRFQAIVNLNVHSRDGSRRWTQEIWSSLPPINTAEDTLTGWNNSSWKTNWNWQVSYCTTKAIRQTHMKEIKVIWVRPVSMEGTQRKEKTRWRDTYPEGGSRRAKCRAPQSRILRKGDKPVWRTAGTNKR